MLLENHSFAVVVDMEVEVVVSVLLVPLKRLRMALIQGPQRPCRLRCPVPSNLPDVVVVVYGHQARAEEVAHWQVPLGKGDTGVPRS